MQFRSELVTERFHLLLFILTIVLVRRHLSRKNRLACLLFTSLSLTSACCSTKRTVGTRKRAGACSRLITSAAMKVFPDPGKQVGETSFSITDGTIVGPLEHGEKTSNVPYWRYFSNL